MHKVAKELTVVRQEMSGKFYEQDNTIMFLILAVLSKEHPFLLGQPGVAKSQMIRELVARITNLPYYFETIMSRTRDAATVLGQYSVKELKENDNYVRKTEGYIQDAVLATIDEIGKMGPTMGHDLLPILLERLYHEVGHGCTARPVPLYTCFTASNELIVGESDEAKALWDRLPLRTEVKPMRDPGNQMRLMDDAVLKLGLPPISPATVDWPELADVIDTVVPSIPMSMDAKETMVRLMGELRGVGIDVSPRSMFKSVRVLQAHAFLEGRTEVTEDDVNVCRFMFWDTPDQIPELEKVCLVVSNPMAEKVLTVMDLADEIMAGVRSRKGESLESRARYGSEAHAKVKSLMSEIGTLKQDALSAGRGTSKLDEADRRLAEVRKAIYTECLDFDSAPSGV
jgi:MoxR-like ATPase